MTKKYDKDRSRSYHINNVKSFTKRHVNYHAIMTIVVFPGAWDLDRRVPFYNVVQTTEVEGYLSLQGVLYNKLKLMDGHSFIAEIYQQHAMANLEAVIPNISKAEMMHLMMSKNVVAYLLNYLVDVRMEKGFVKELLKEFCDPSLLHTTVLAKPGHWYLENKEE